MLKNRFLLSHKHNLGQL